MSSEREIEGKAFKDWFVTQKTYNSLGAMERALNITHDYLHQIRDGTRRAVNPELRQKLQAATGLKEFEPIQILSKDIVYDVHNEKCVEKSEETTFTDYKQMEPPQDSIVRKQLANVEPLIKEIKDLGIMANKILTQLSEVKIAQEISSKKSSNDAETRAKTIMLLLMSLSSELEFFKTCTENERRIFKKIIPGQDVGYITTLLRALYDEDKLQRWLLFSTYTMKGNER
jgi:hypothetical protein